MTRFRLRRVLLAGSAFGLLLLATIASLDRNRSAIPESIPDGTTEPEIVIARQRPSGFSERVGSAPDRPSSGPDVATHIRGIPIWELPEHEIDVHLEDLRQLVDAGWSQAFVPLAPIAAACIASPPRSDREVREIFDPEYGSWHRYNGIALESSRDRAAMRETRMQLLQRQLGRAGERQQRCRAGLGANPDRLMDWMELALEQQPAGFFAVMLEYSSLPPESMPWLVRNAERMARFNLGFLSALRARFASGDPEVVGRAWKAFATQRFLPEPDPVQAWAFGLVARRLPPPLSDTAPTADDRARLIKAGLDPAAQDRAREVADALWQQCCAGGSGARR